MGPPTALLKEIARFRKRLADRLGSVETLILFGSQATGTTHEDSDVDLIVVSQGFRDLSSLKRGALAHLVWDLPHPVDFICYTPEEYERLKNQVSIVKVALDEGVEIGA